MSIECPECGCETNCYVAVAQAVPQHGRTVVERVAVNFGKGKLPEQSR
ncbi:hypothetical protein [Pseudanabaena sp. PCC 6802]|nr:hypothetical protein [Pseudanabaena sp. PCC 6802]